MLGAIITRFQLEEKKQKPAYFENASLFVLVAAAAFIVVMAFLFLVGILKPSGKAFDIIEQCKVTTEWLKSKDDIYYILGKQLFKIKAQGGERQLVFEANAPIRGYHFSLDGKYLLIQTQMELFLLDRGSYASKLIDQVSAADSEEEMKGVISGVRWSPDSRHFCYELSRWSKIITRDLIYVYDAITDTKRDISSATRKISSLYWDKAGENLYFLKYKFLDPSQRATNYEVLIVQIPLATLEPKVAATILYNDQSFPVYHLLSRGIEIFSEGDDYSFTARADNVRYPSKTGLVIGIDPRDYMYFVRNKWFKKRLFHIPRWQEHKTPMGVELKGDYMVDQIAWSPESDYLVLRHRSLGILALDPFRGAIGKLSLDQGHTFGWAPKNPLVATPETR